MKKIMLLSIIGIIGCSEPSDAVRALENNGFSNVTITDSSVAAE